MDLQYHRSGNRRRAQDASQVLYTVVATSRVVYRHSMGMVVRVTAGVFVCL